jgi:HPt (histidine-containing phosphotransfer) domain-containing protein
MAHVAARLGVANEREWGMGMYSAAEDLVEVRPQLARRSDAPIDRAHLARYTFGSVELELEVLGLFAGQAPETLAMLTAADQTKAWRDAAHTLKGSARAVGAWRVADRAAEAEALKDNLDPLRRETALRALGEALDEACNYIQDLVRAGP